MYHGGRLPCRPLAKRDMSDSPHSPGSPPLQTELDGVSLHLARKKDHATGYKGVKKNGHRFKVEVTIQGKNKYITSRDTAVEAALAYAQYLENPELFARPEKTPTPKITDSFEAQRSSATPK